MQTTQNRYTLVWFTTNLRTQDNAILVEALRLKKLVIAIYCFNPQDYENTSFGFKKTEKFRARFTIESVHDLKIQLETLNIPLFTVHEKPELAISSLCEKYHITDVFVQKEFTQEETNIIDAVKLKTSQNSNWHEVYDQFLFQPDDGLRQLNKIPKVFTNFRKILEKECSVRPLITPEKQELFEIKNNTEIPTLKTLGFSEFETHAHSAFPFSGGETAAQNRLYNYVFETKKIGFYKKTRNGLLGVDYSSKFSAWLANGCISARQIYWAIQDFEKEHFKNQSTYWLIFELIWRDFFKYIAWQHGNAIFHLEGINNHTYQWKTDPELIQKWCSGNTSEPFINANMIELNKTGWMSNRGRQNVASYFAKTLEIDWRIGAAYFESLLIDYDVHSNYGNWLYVAGVGNDPRSRTFNVKLQADRYDSQGKFQKRWLQNTLFE
ncbi:DASH family cryptochrome [Bizionia argentinensis JUB59]|uniref:Cryptochrome DASH n=1 Tax=Bizionia argentinensis JUB59 TaxID=1046627 RepID=G2ECG8_9FLAO|nr:DASH family cryptochrome [Bizionia argentinensis]EGV43885.2 DASH family cryptochrome [Bizionia argentinensis JUB59]